MSEDPASVAPDPPPPDETSKETTPEPSSKEGRPGEAPPSDDGLLDAFEMLGVKEPSPAAAGTGALTMEGLQAELELLRSNFAMAQWEKQSALGDAEQLSTERRVLADQLALAKSDLERERTVLKAEVAQEVARRSQLEKDLASVRQELESTLAELRSHRSGKEKLEKIASGYERAESDLQTKEQEISSLKTQLEEAAETQAQTQAQCQSLDLEVSRVSLELEEAKGRAAQLQTEVEAARKTADGLRATVASLQVAAASAASASGASAPAAAPASPPGKERIVPSLPVLFLSSDGKSIAKQAFFAVGKGESLEALLSALLKQWTSLKLPLVAAAGTEGLSLRIQGDPHRRSIRVMPTGAFQIQLSPPELEQVRDLPALVSKKSASAGAVAKAPSPPA